MVPLTILGLICGVSALGLIYYTSAHYEAIFLEPPPRLKDTKRTDYL